MRIKKVVCVLFLFTVLGISDVCLAQDRQMKDAELAELKQQIIEPQRQNNGYMILSINAGVLQLCVLAILRCLHHGAQERLQRGFHERWLRLDRGRKNVRRTVGAQMAG
jgi:signal transduction histidine kinase